MSYEYLCKGCFAKREASGQCPLCGFDEEKYVVPLHSLLPGVILNSRYIIGKVLGSGGFGITYIAYDTKLESIMAIKEYLPKSMAQRASDNISVSLHSEDFKKEFQHYMDSFLNEARILAKFNDELGITSVQDVFRENGTVYIVMYYVSGVTFEEYLSKNQDRLPYPKVMQIMTVIMESLKKIHAEGVIHRDISPDNIYITPDDNVKLLDFGAARYFIGEDKSTVSIILKRGYAPIEQYQNKIENQGPWTDIYSLSATMYRALTGTKPPDVLERLDADILKSPGELGFELPDHIESAVMRGLNLKYSDRPKTLDDFMRLLKPVGRTEIIKDPITLHEDRKSVKKKIRMPILIVLALLISVSVFMVLLKPGNGNGPDLTHDNISASNSGQGTTLANQGAMGTIDPSKMPGTQIPDNSGSTAANPSEGTVKPSESPAADATATPTEPTEAVSESAITEKQSEAASEPGMEEKPQASPSATLKSPVSMGEKIDSPTPDQLKDMELTEGIYADVQQIGAYISLTISIYKDKLPDRLPESFNVYLCSSDAITDKGVLDMVAYQKSHNPVNLSWEYDGTRQYYTFNQSRKYTILLFFDTDMNFLGYYLYQNPLVGNPSPSPSASVQPSPAQQKPLKVADGIVIDTDSTTLDHTLYMYKDKLPAGLPELMKVAICNTNDVSEAAILDSAGIYMRDRNVSFTFDGRSGDYYHWSDSGTKYEAVFLFDTDMNFIGYFIYQNPLKGSPSN